MSERDGIVIDLGGGKTRFITTKQIVAQMADDFEDRHGTVSMDDEVSICAGYQFPAGMTCGASKDEEDKLYCDTCTEQAALAAKEREAEAYREGFGVAPVTAYPHLTD